MSPTERRVVELDGLRGLAILMVLAWHLGAKFDALAREIPALELLNRLRMMGWSGVDLFFVLSGFLIGGIVIDRHRAPDFFKVFYIRRACRILPIYFALLALFFALRPLGIPDHARLFTGELPSWTYPTFLQNFAAAWKGTTGAQALGITWSLAVEEQFYLVAPILIAGVTPRLLPFLLLAGMAVALLCRLIILSNFDAYAVGAGVLMPCRADGLLAGVLAAWLVRRPGARESLAENIRGLRWIFGVLLIGFLLFAFSQFGVMHYFTLSIGHSWLALFYASALLLVLHARTGILVSICRWRWLAWLGRISYFVYLFHQLINGLLHSMIRKAPPSIASFEGAGVTALAGAATLGLAALSFRLFEGPIIQHGHRFKYADQTGA